MLHHIASLVVIMLAAVASAIGIWSFGQQRQLRASRARQVAGETMNGVNRQDLVNVTRAVARLQASHDATRQRIGGLQHERDDLKEELGWLLSELAVRPEPHPIVRYLRDNGPQTFARLRHHLGEMERGELQALVNSHQIAPVDGEPERRGERFRFVPHHQRPTTDAGLVPLNRYLALLVTNPGTSDEQIDLVPDVALPIEVQSEIDSTSDDDRAVA